MFCNTQPSIWLWYDRASCSHNSGCGTVSDSQTSGNFWGQYHKLCLFKQVSALQTQNLWLFTCMSGELFGTHSYVPCIVSYHYLEICTMLHIIRQITCDGSQLLWISTPLAQSYFVTICKTVSCTDGLKPKLFSKLSHPMHLQYIIITHFMMIFFSDALPMLCYEISSHLFWFYMEETYDLINSMEASDTRIPWYIVTVGTHLCFMPFGISLSMCWLCKVLFYCHLCCLCFTLRPEWYMTIPICFNWTL